MKRLLVASDGNPGDCSCSPRKPFAAFDGFAKILDFGLAKLPTPAPKLDSGGLKISTLEEDFTLSNHGFFPNPTYSAATIELLLQGSLTCRLAGREVPAEFGHNMPRLYDAYWEYVDADLQWFVPSDPSGEASQRRRKSPSWKSAIRCGRRS
jgi:hypothetical protein